MIRTSLLLFLICLAAAAPIPADATSSLASSRPVHRFALLIGSDDGGAERPSLRYATSDAQTLGAVLAELGGILPQDEKILREPTLRQLQEAFLSLKKSVEGARAGGARTEIVVYYSGHSDDEGLLPRGERFTYGALRSALASVPADLRVTILDSCASGAFARTKGGRYLPAFLVDSAMRLQGNAVLTSSSSDEASQESDRVKGSYFTHHLVSGLRGAADVSQDGRVTLTEAYQFAFRETLAHT